MSEGIKDIIFDVKDSLSETPKKMYKYNKITFNLNELSEILKYVEQLEKENKELKQPQVFVDCEDMEERYGRDLYEDYLKEKIEQLENIRKEAIEMFKNINLEKYYHGMSYEFDINNFKDDLLNILNKGDNNGK